MAWAARLALLVAWLLCLFITVAPERRVGQEPRRDGDAIASSRHLLAAPREQHGPSPAATGLQPPAQPLRRLVQEQQQDDISSSSDSFASTSQGLCEREPSAELFERRARSNTVLLAVANSAQWDFAQNWLQHVKRAGMDYYVIAAADKETSERLAAMGEPCFEWLQDSPVASPGLEWGSEGWRRMTWAKVFVLDAVVDWGFNLVVSDVDVVWFKDPLPLFAQHREADLLFSEDGTTSRNDPGDDGLRKDGSQFVDFNTGVYLLRYNAEVAAWAHAWRQLFDQCTEHDQMCLYELMRTHDPKEHPDNPRVGSGWHNRVWIGILPPSIAMNAHSFFLQQLHMVKQVQPYVVHLTWTYNGLDGKRSRLRDMGLWLQDPPEYYDNGGFVTVDLQLPEAPAGYNSWNENEDMVSFHLDTIHAQLQQAYVGMAMAVAVGRAFLLPKFQCYCEKIWYAVVRCRVADSQDMPLPVTCPQDYLFHPGHYADEPRQYGTPLNIREASFLDNERTPAEVKDSLLIIQPSATLECSDCVQEEATPDGVPKLLVPPQLTDTQLSPLLEPYRRYRVWRLSFDGVGNIRRAYGGFRNSEATQRFNARMEHITTDFCCRREEEAPRYHKEREMAVKLSMATQFRFEPQLNS